MELTKNTIIGQLVAEDYRTAAIFSQFKIDFCCKGNQSIGEVCEKKKINSEQLLSALSKQTASSENADIDYKSWPLDLLADYIEKKHHRYVAEKTPILQQYLKKISAVHGQQHPELLTIAQEFDGCAAALAAHMKKEELILFPAIRKMITQAHTSAARPPKIALQQPIQVMQDEHEQEGERFRKMAELSNNYTPPEDACNTYRVTYAMLNEFEKDLHLHIHLENNILFPKAQELEKNSLISNT